MTAEPEKCLFHHYCDPVLFQTGMASDNMGSIQLCLFVILRHTGMTEKWFYLGEGIMGNFYGFITNKV